VKGHDGRQSGEPDNELVVGFATLPCIGYGSPIATCLITAAIPIIITTGTFTSEALQEARRDGVAPVALVDRNKLIDLIRKLKIQL
jgi:hypothetical protein